MPRIVFAMGLLLARQNAEALDAEVDAEEAAFACFGADAAGDEELVHVRAAKGDVAGGDISAVVLADELAARIEDLNLLHAIVGDVEIAGRVEAHAVGLVVDLDGGTLGGQIG